MSSLVGEKNVDCRRILTERHVGEAVALHGEHENLSVQLVRSLDGHRWVNVVELKLRSIKILSETGNFREFNSRESAEIEVSEADFDADRSAVALIYVHAANPQRIKHRQTELGKAASAPRHDSVRHSHHARRVSVVASLLILGCGCKLLSEFVAPPDKRHHLRNLAP